MDKFWYSDEEIKPDLDGDLLAHYGIKGMKWRRHKSRRRNKKLVENQFDPEIPMVDESYRTPLEQLYSRYNVWYNNTKWGKFWNRPVDEFFGASSAQASSGNKPNDEMLFYDSHGRLKKDRRMYYEGAKRRITNKR